MPRQWTAWDSSEVWRLGWFILSSYAVLAIVSALTVFQTLRQQGRQSHIWYFIWLVACLSAVMTLVTPGSNNNVWIPLGVWFILVGTIGLKCGLDHYPIVDRLGLHLLGLGLSFVLLLYNPLAVIVPIQANAAYANLVNTLKSFKQPIYAPDLGQLQSDYQFHPDIHWVPLTDIIRGPGVDLSRHPALDTYLSQVLHPRGNPYILTNFPLEQNSPFSFLIDSYRLTQDFGERFRALATLPKRYYLGYPRYLYQFTSAACPAQLAPSSQQLTEPGSPPGSS